MEKAKLYIPIKVDIMESLSTEKDTEREFSCKKGVSFRDSLVTISLKVMGLCKIRMEIAIMGSGKITKCMEKESISGRTETSIRVGIKREREKVLGQ
jgi:hypothetical protein